MLLNPCEWSYTTPTVTVGTGETKTGFGIAMKSGKQLTVRLDDAQHLLDSPVQRVPGETVHPVLVQISSPFGLHLSHTITNDVGGQTHSWTVPVGVAVKLDVWSSSASVKGQADAPSFNINEGILGASGKPTILTVQFAPYDPPRQYRFTIQAKGK